MSTHSFDERENTNLGAHLPDGLYDGEILSFHISPGHTKGYFVSFTLRVRVDGDYEEVQKEHNIVSPPAMEVLRRDLAPVDFHLNDLVDFYICDHGLIGMKVVVKKKTNGPHVNWYLVRKGKLTDRDEQPEQPIDWSEIAYAC